MKIKAALKAVLFMLSIIFLVACGGIQEMNSPIFRDRSLVVGSSQNEITDQALLEYASRRYDRSKVQATAQIGRHNGTPVIEAFFCGDICPLYTVRVIHYELMDQQSCADVNGIETEVRMPRRKLSYQKFCFPKGVRYIDEIGALIID